MATPSVITNFFSEVSEIFRSTALLDFPGATVEVTPQNRCKFIWDTVQDDSCPHHVLEWDCTNASYIEITSFQYSKTIAPRPDAPRNTVAFRIPTATAVGMREILNHTMETLKTDFLLLEKLHITSVTMEKDTPKETVWILTRESS